jgi:hypothetical protein
MDATTISSLTTRQMSVSTYVPKVLIYMEKCLLHLAFCHANQDFLPIQLRECAFQAVMPHIIPTLPVGYVF